MHFGAQSRGLRAPCERFAPWVTPGPRITRFRLAADLGRMGLDTHRVSNKVSKITSRHLVPLDRAFPAHALLHESSRARTMPPDRIFHLPLRQTEGFLRSIVGMLCLDLSAPDHTTLSRRGQHLDLALRRLPAGAGIHLIVDSTGLSTVGEGEWAAVKHGGRGIRGWKKLHLGVDGSGVIVAHALTGGHVDDATTALDLIDKVEGDVSCLTADAAYDTRGIYEAAGARGATVVIPPTRTATVSGRRPRSPARDRTIRQVQQAGRRQWKKDSGYHQQARVENAFFRYKLIIGESLRARSRAGQETEAILACNILNQMTQRGRPASYAIGR